MISKADFDRNSAVLRVLHKLKLFPIRVATFDGSFVPIAAVSNGRTRLPFWFAFVWALFHGLYVGIRLGQYLVTRGLVEEYEMVLNLNMAAASVFCFWWYWVYFVRHPDIVVAVMSMLQYQAGQPADGVPRLQKYSRQDWIAAMMTAVGISSGLGVVMLYCLDPSMDMLIISAFNLGQRRTYLQPVFMLEETYFVLFLVTCALFPIYTHVLFFDVAIKGLKNAESNAETCYTEASYSVRHFMDSYKKIRELHLWVQLFNHLNGYGIFLFKFYCIFLATVWGFFAVSHMDHLPYSVIFFAIFMDQVLLYAVLYEKAFQVPGEFKKVKKAVLVGISRTGMERKYKKYAERCMWSIPSLGIRVGSFHTFERTSTPIFIDFIVRNIAGLIVMKL